MVWKAQLLQFLNIEWCSKRIGISPHFISESSRTGSFGCCRMIGIAGLERLSEKDRLLKNHFRRWSL